MRLWQARSFERIEMANSPNRNDQRDDSRRQTLRVMGIALAVIAVTLAGWWLFNGVLAPDPTPVAVDLTAERPLAQLPPAQRNGFYDAPPPLVIDTASSYEAVITMANGGEMRLRLFVEQSPMTVNNFVFLAQQGFFDGVTFHRVIDGFVAQGGDPAGNGRGGPGYQFADEVDNGLLFDRPGLVAMANSGPNTNGSQFFITYAPLPSLNGGYSIFGELSAGQDTLDNLTRIEAGPFASEPVGDVIERITIEEIGD